MAENIVETPSRSRPLGIPTHRQFEAHWQSFVPAQQMALQQQNSVRQKSWINHRRPSNLPTVPTSAIRSLAIDDGETPWARAWHLHHLQTCGTRTDSAEKGQSRRRHRAVDPEQQQRPYYCLPKLSLRRLPRPAVPLTPQPTSPLQQLQLSPRPHTHPMYPHRGRHRRAVHCR